MLNHFLIGFIYYDERTSHDFFDFFRSILTETILKNLKINIGISNLKFNLNYGYIQFNSLTVLQLQLVLTNIS